MKLGRMNHVGIATPDIEASIAFYRDVMGATDITEPFVLEEQKVRVCFVNTPNHSGGDAPGGTEVELLEPTGDDSPISGFLARNPEGGQHHLCFEVEDIEAAREWFTSQGKRILGPTRIGAHKKPIFFVHPKDMNGILTEIMEVPRGGH